jgi:hypothetical protein
MSGLLPGRWLKSPRPAVYITVLLAVVAASLATKVRLRGVFACPASYAGPAYLSDCNAASYGDYDHGATWFGLEPETRRAASNASVMLVGNSRVQFGFSSPVTVRWFGERSIPFYSLGFSHYESVTFMTPVLARVKPHAKAYVINADRFFAEWYSPASHLVMFERDARSRYDEKQFWQRLHKPACGAMPFLCGHEFAVYRTVANGLWFTAGAKPNHPKVVSDGPPSDRERWPHYADLARKFIDGLGVDRQCIVLTIVPTVGTKRAEAQAIADALGVQFIAPRVNDLTTFDGSHLDVKSADRWSAAFLDAAGPVLEHCIGKSAKGAQIPPPDNNGS